MNQNSQLKKPLLYALVVSVILGALLGIVLVLRNQWGWLEVRVMLTTVIIAVASVCGLACDLSRTPAGLNLLPRSGLVLTAITALLLLAGVWGDINEEGFWKTTMVVTTFAVATVHLSLLSIAKLDGRFRWVYFIGCQVIYGLAILIASIILFEINSEPVFRFLAAHSIVVAAFSLVIPILHRIGRSEDRRGELLMPVEERNVESIDKQIAALEKQIVQLKRLREKLIAGGRFELSS